MGISSLVSIFRGHSKSKRKNKPNIFAIRGNPCNPAGVSFCTGFLYCLYGSTAFFLAAIDCIFF